MHHYKKKILIFSIIVFALSLLPEAYCYDNCTESVSSLLLLTVGWMGLFFGGAALSWLANPLIFAAWFLYKKGKTSLILSGMALLAALSFTFFNEIMINEAGHYGDISKYLSGYYLWVLSIFSFFSANLYIRIQQKK